MKRLFISLPSPVMIQKEIESIQKEWQRRIGGSIRWVRPDIAHLTLHFLGYTDESRVPEIINMIKSSAAGLEPLQLALKNLNGFPNVTRARVAIIEVGELNGNFLLILQKKLSAGLKLLDFKIEDKPFISHITLGRLRQSTALATKWYIPKLVSWRTNIVQLMESQLSPSGPSYKVLASIKLG